VSGGFRVVEIFTFATVEFDGLNVGKVGHTGRKERVVLAHDAGTFAKIAFLVFLKLNTVSTSFSILLRDFGGAYHFR